MTLNDGSLREALANRFAEIHSYNRADDVYETYADECIRQMEWASRVEGGKVHSGELTIAPEDWKP